MVDTGLTKVQYEHHWRRISAFLPGMIPLFSTVCLSVFLGRISTCVASLTSGVVSWFYAAGPSCVSSVWVKRGAVVTRLRW
jgi:hypothetical protein